LGPPFSDTGPLSKRTKRSRSPPLAASWGSVAACGQIWHALWLHSGSCWDLFQNISFFTEILPYLQFMYTIKEIKSEKVYTKFLSSFLSSSQYKVYDQHHTSINRTFRWCNTLIDSLDKF